MTDPAPAPRPNLTDLADRSGSVKGSAEHRYTEPDPMLFLPDQDRAPDCLEMDRQISGPQQGQSADRPLAVTANGKISSPCRRSGGRPCQQHASVSSVLAPWARRSR